jgi:Fic family protein
MNDIELLKTQYLSKINKINIPNSQSFKLSNEFGYTNINTLASIFSNNIEGNSIDINTYFNYNSAFKKKKEKAEIDDLAAAYEYAKNNPLNLKNLKKAHAILSKSSLESFQRGKFKTIPNGLFGSLGLIYIACSPEKTADKIDELFELIINLGELSDQEVMFYGSYIHMRIAHMHPFIDGNGRISRLVEKWFLAQKIGSKAWYIPLEQYYFEHRNEYYTNLNLGPNFEELDYSRSLEFLLMSSQSIK